MNDNLTHRQFGLQFVNRVIRGMVAKDCLYDDRVSLLLVILLKDIRNESDSELQELIAALESAIESTASNSITITYGPTQVQYNGVDTVVSHLQNAQVTLTTSTFNFKKLLDEWKLFLEEFPPEGLSLKYGNVNGY